jgi:hypothetical protein
MNKKMKFYNAAEGKYMGDLDILHIMTVINRFKIFFENFLSREEQLLIKLDGNNVVDVRNDSSDGFWEKLTQGDFKSDQDKRLIH